MPILYLLELALQVACAMHAYRTGKDRYWLFLIMAVPGLGCLIYFLTELLPDLIHGSTGRAAKKKIRRVLDPEADYRDAKYAFDTTPTVDNRIRLAQILNARRDYDAVIALLEPALTNHFADDIMLLEGLAYAYYDKGDYMHTLKYIRMIYDRPDPPQDYIKLLRCRTLIASGQLEQARAELTHLIPFFTGEEVRITLAQLHEKMGNRNDARTIYQDIVTRSKHAPDYYVKQERNWIDIAKRGLG